MGDSPKSRRQFRQHDPVLHAQRRHLSSMLGAVLYLSAGCGDVHDGDIVLGDAAAVAREWQEFQTAHPGGVTSVPSGSADGQTRPLGNTIDQGTAWSHLWPNGVVSYRMVGLTAAQAVTVRAGFDTWAPAGITMRSCGVGTTCGYVVQVKNGNPGPGNCGLSRVGMTPDSPGGSVQTITIDFTNCTDIKSAAVHEMGHTIGLYHEHQRSDRNDYVKVAASIPVKEDDDGNYGIGHDSRVGTDLIATGRYDFESTMHYSAGSNPVKITLADGTPLPSSVGSKPRPSPGDLSAVVSMYSPTTPTTIAPQVGYLFQNFPGAPYPEFESTPGLTASSRQIGSETINALAAIGGDRALWVRTRSSRVGDWTEWQFLDGELHSPPGIAVKPEGGFVVVVLASDIQTYCIWEGGWNCDINGEGGWPSGYLVEGDTPSVVADNDGNIWVMVHARDSAFHDVTLTNVRYPGGYWGGWFQWIQGATGAPSMILTPLGLVAFYLDATDGGIHDTAGVLPSQGTKPKSVNFTGGVTVVSRSFGTDAYSDTHYDVFALDGNKIIWSLSKKRGSWGSWKRLSGPAYTFPAVSLLLAESPSIPVELTFGGSFGFFTGRITSSGDREFYDPTHLNNIIWHNYAAP